MAIERIGVASQSSRSTKPVVLSMLLVAVVVTALIAYKGSVAIQKLHDARSGTLHWTQQPSASGAVRGSLEYLRIVWLALLFGVALSAAVHATVPPAALARLFARGGMREHARAALAGAPLMLCSCCSAPLFSTVYKRSGGLGPALALMLAPPSLNPAALALSFMLLPARIAVTRLGMAITLVLLGAALVARLSDDSPVLSTEGEKDEQVGLGRAFMHSVAHVSIRTVPWILFGVFLSFWIAARVPLQGRLDAAPLPVLVLVASVIALLLSLPTFFEIPLALSALAAGAPAGVAAVILFAGPAVNLPSLLVVGRNSNWRTAVLIGAVALLIAFLGGLAVGR